MYGAFAEHLGPEARELESSYWVLGDLDLVGSLLEAAGLRVTGTRTRVGTARFGSAEQAVTTELEASPLAGRIDRDTYRRVVEATVEVMSPFVVDGGRVELPIGGHLITAAKAAEASAGEQQRSSDEVELTVPRPGQEGVPLVGGE
jgi:hypothetical protein